MLLVLKMLFLIICPSPLIKSYIKYFHNIDHLSKIEFTLYTNNALY